CAEWSALPFEAGAFDLVVGDGCFTLLDFPRGVGAAVAECHRVLAKEGRFVIRLFAAPEHREPLAAVAHDLTAGHIGSFHILKWRIAMALQPSAALGVRLGDIWDAFAELCPDRVALAVQRGWPREVIATIDNYRGSDIRYTFPRVAEVRVLLADAWRELACHVPGYELGDRCPTLVFERRG
ncbi:MAG: methyltransferase domain-containing protein, partial [Myxococcales bacterium]|nr:methyltransferase domain-containing protein [Myxococcales bacterium]